jgi:cyclopropane fatty-acyl-phospholipid synthase-like methyltransferase
VRRLVGDISPQQYRHVDIALAKHVGVFTPVSGHCQYGKEMDRLMANGKRDFDKDAQSWDENPVRRQLGEAVGNAIATALSLKNSDTVLDYGAGTGLVSLALCQRVSRVLAADSSRGMLDVLAGKLAAAGIANIQPVFLDLEDPATTPPAVDAIVSSMTLHHVRDVPRLARIFFSMIGSGGCIAMADLSTEAGDFHPDNTGVHHFGFAADWLRATFAAAGFADVRTTVAHTIRKQVTSGETKDFPILLLTAVKP